MHQEGTGVRRPCCCATEKSNADTCESRQTSDPSPAGGLSDRLMGFFADLRAVGTSVATTVALYTMIGGLIGALAAAVPALIEIAHDHQSHRRRAVCGEYLATHERSAREVKIGGGSEQPLE